MLWDTTREAGKALMALGLKWAHFPKSGVGFSLRMDMRTICRHSNRYTEPTGKVIGHLTGRDYGAQAAMADRVAEAGFDVRVLTLKRQPCHVHLEWTERPGKVEWVSAEEMDRQRAELLKIAAWDAEDAVR